MLASMVKQHLEFIADVVSRITLTQPGARVDFFPVSKFGDPALVLSNRWPDAHFDDGEVKEFHYYEWVLPEFTDEMTDEQKTKLVVDWVYKTCIESAVHEIGEWLHYEDVPVYNPHLTSTKLEITPPHAFTTKEHFEIIVKDWTEQREQAD